ncbi:MAG: hypothetical protein HY351_00385 [Candidatus Omnitrophica bacterium]|nr:hypothetical protein [Candidatus Omnitrophota bacterium]
MSTLFESLKKLEEKQKATAQGAPRVSVVSGEELEPDFSPKWLVISFIVLAVVFVGFAIFSHFKYQELRATVSSGHTGLDDRFKDLTNQIQGLAKNLDTTKQAVVKRLDSFSQELDQQRDAQSRFTAQQTKLTQQNKSAAQTQIDEKFNLLSRRVSLLEESGRSNAPSEERRY